MIMQELVGKKIVDVLTNEDQEVLVFVSLDGFFVYAVFGDCCSKSWFESINWIDNLKGEVVVEVADKYPNEYSSDERPGYITINNSKIYGVTIKTKKGYTDIEFRNSSQTGEDEAFCDYIPHAEVDIKNKKVTYGGYVDRYTDDWIYISPWKEKI